jgi:hypothetical protein
MLRNSRSHLAVQHQLLLTGSDVGPGHSENCSLDSMATELIQMSESSATIFKDDALEVTVILH